MACGLTASKTGVTVSFMQDPIALLESFLAEHEMSQSELARRAGVGPSTIQKLLARRRFKPDLDTALGIESATCGRVPVAAWSSPPSLAQQSSDSLAVGHDANLSADCPTGEVQS
jgi:transcriptional regulator with XRE-family HTH domain